MGYRQFDENTSWEQCRKDTRTTKTALEASEVHGNLAPPVKEALDQWDILEIERRKADDDVVDCNARVTVCDQRLDLWVSKLVSRLLYESNQDRQAKPYSLYFKVAPNEIMRLGLESEIKKVQSFFVVADEQPPSQEVRAILDEMKTICTKGEILLSDRVKAYQHQAAVSLRIQSWKEDTNGVRRYAANQLDAYAITNKYPKDYVDAYFPEAPKRTKKDKPDPDSSGNV